MSTVEAKELADSLNLRLLETSATNEKCGTSETCDTSETSRTSVTGESGKTIDESLTLPKRERSDVDSKKAHLSKSFDEIEDEASMLTRQIANHKCPGSLVQAEGDKHEAVDQEGAVPRSTEIERQRERHRSRRSLEVRQHYTTKLPPADVTTCAVQHANRKHARKSWRSDVPIILLGCMVNTHSVPVLGLPGRLLVAHSTITTGQHRNNQ